MIGRSGERGSGISELAARHDDNDIRQLLKGSKREQERGERDDYMGHISRERDREKERERE